MLLFSIFIVAAILTFLGLRSPVWTHRFSRGPRREGVIVVVAVLLATGLGWLIFDFTSNGGLANGIQYSGLYFLGLVASMYLFAALRRRLQLPFWLNDIFLILVSYASLLLVHGTTIQVLSAPISTEYIGLGKWATFLTIVWMWLIARMTAAMNRAPQVTGGYLGVVAIALLVLLKLKNDDIPPFFPAAASAALAGAGLMTVPLALRRADFNIGWSASVAMGFLLAQIATVGLLKNATFFMLLLSMVAFGMPLLDVSLFHLRAAMRGEHINVEEQKLRLHEALRERGVAPSKISMLYLVIAAWLCGLGVLTARFLFSSSAAWWILGLRGVILLGLFFGGFIVFFSLARVWMRRGVDEIIPDEVEAFGVRISPVSMTEAMDKIEEFIQSKTPHHVVTSDANAILRAQEDEEYAGIVRRAALITPDGFGVVWGARLLNLPIYERVTGVDMVTGICERAAKNGYSIYILGSAEGIASTAAKNLQKTYTGLRVAGTHNGFWRKDGAEQGLSEAEADRKMAQEIARIAPDVLFVAMGIPAQEKFIASQMETMNVPVSLGVGGSFDVYAGKYKRAPEAVQRMGMEWIYRVWIDPSRWKRMGYVPRFMAFALRTWLFGKRPPKVKS